MFGILGRRECSYMSELFETSSYLPAVVCQLQCSEGVCRSRREQLEAFLSSTQLWALSCLLPQSYPRLRRRWPPQLRLLCRGWTAFSAVFSSAVVPILVFFINEAFQFWIVRPGSFYGHVKDLELVGDDSENKFRGKRKKRVGKTTNLKVICFY